MFSILYTESYDKRVRKFLKQNPALKNQYIKCLELLELNPYHPSLRLHKLKGKLKDLYSVSINITYRITIEFQIIEERIIPIDIGSHDEVYE